MTTAQKIKRLRANLAAVRAERKALERELAATPDYRAEILSCPFRAAGFLPITPGTSGAPTPARHD